MGSGLRSTIPSMFHRRLLLLVAGLVIVMALLVVQTARLTSGQQHEERRAAVEQALLVPDLTPTVRGRIFDRKGRVLAEDRPGWDVTVSFRVMNGEWAFGRAYEAARRDLGERWSALNSLQREATAFEYIDPYNQQVESLWVTLAALGRVDPRQVWDRRDRTLRWVQLLSADATARLQQRRLNALRDDSASVDWNEVYVEVKQEYQSHPILFDVTDQTRSRVQYFIARAHQQQERFEQALKENPRAADKREYLVWLQVAPEFIKQRRYPWEKRTLMFDRSTLPGPLASEDPVEISVEGIGRHIIGQLRRVHNGDRFWHQRPFRRTAENGETVVDLSGYLPNDPVGRLGIERSMEPVLRGTRGRRVLYLETGELKPDARPEQGGDVHLTLDIRLQARLQAIMSHDPRIGLMLSQPWHGVNRQVSPDNPAPLQVGDAINGAAVVMSIDNSQILAAVSVPGISIHQLETNDIGIYSDHVNRPYLFRPVQYRYEPGSTNKPLVLAAAISDGILGPDEKLDLTLGRLWEDHPGVFRDWRVKAGGPSFGVIDGVEAMKVSSNVFFGKLAQRWGRHPAYGLGRLVEWFESFGFGRSVGCGLDEEVAGFLPDPDEDHVSESQAAYMTIGEGAMAVTPMQVANAHATLGRGGVFIPPTFVQDRSRIDGSREAVNIHLSPAARDRALRGMYESANAAGGTSRGIRFDEGYEMSFDCRGVRVLAKSGTAEPPPLRESLPDGRADPDGAIVRNGNHAWMVALLQPEGASRPTIAVAVVCEFAGSGGRVAGPIVNQIAYALQAEGYLPPPRAEAIAAGDAVR